MTTCHRDPGKALKWIREVEEDGMTVDRLGEGRSRWKKLDRKPLHAVHKLAETQKHTSLYRCVLNEQESQLRRGLVFTGRQALFTIYRFYEVNRDTATIMNIEGLMSLRYPGDHQMEQFYNNWNEIMNYQRPNLNDLELATTLWRKLQGSQQLKTVVDIWDSLPKSDPKRLTSICGNTYTDTSNGTGRTESKRPARRRRPCKGVSPPLQSMTRFADSGSRATASEGTNATSNTLQIRGASPRVAAITQARLHPEARRAVAL